MDRIVLRAYCRSIQAPAGFRIWWRRWQGSDEKLDNAYLIRLAGRFGRRVRAWAEKAHVPVIFSSAGERKDEIADAHLPTDPTFRGVFLVVVGRAPASVLKVQRTTEHALEKDDDLLVVSRAKCLQRFWDRRSNRGGGPEQPPVARAAPGRALVRSSTPGKTGRLHP